MKSMTTCGALVITAAVASAQPAGLEVGGYVGRTSTNVVTMRGNRTSWPHEGAEGLLLGAYFRYAVRTPVVLEANLVYAQKGYDVDPEVRVHYVEAPLLVRFDVFEGMAPRLFAFAGVAPAIRAGCSQSGMYFDNEVHEGFSYSGSCEGAPLPRTPTRFDLGGVFGGGIGWRFGFGMLELQGRMVTGLVDVGGRSGDKTVNKASYLLLGFGKTY